MRNIVKIITLKSATIILERSNRDVLLVERSKSLSFFPGFFVFPGGKIDEELSANWIGDEDIVVQTVIRELYEEVGILGSSTRIINPKDRSQDDFAELKSNSKVESYPSELTFIGRRKTPPFRKTIFDAAYFLCSKKFVDFQNPIPDGEEIVSLLWIQPEDAINRWKTGKLKLPPPTLHTLRLMAFNRENFETISLVETNLPTGLQTKIEFAPGIMAIPITSNTIPPFFNTNLVILESEGQCLIVDPGANNTSKSHLREILLALPSSPKVFITHHHTDHWDGLDVVEAIFPEAEVFGHVKMISRISTKLKTTSIINESLFVGLREIQVIYAPGHTDDHSVLFDTETRTIIAGDHVVGWGSAVLSSSNGNMRDYLKTCENLIELNPRLIIPAHGPPNFNPIGLLEKYISHRLERENSILEAVNKGYHTLDDIVKVVYHDVPDAMWEFAKSNILLHLRKLIDESKTEVKFPFL